MCSEEILHSVALKALAATVDQANFDKPLLMCRFQVSVDDIEDVPRLKAVKIDGVFYLENDNIF